MARGGSTVKLIHLREKSGFERRADIGQLDISSRI